jgi:archaellum biogenesis ATPase FlaH
MSALLKEERTIVNFLEASIGLKGLRDSDEFFIDVFQESKKCYKLNRFKYTIKGGPRFNFDFIKSEIQLPYFQIDNCEFELVLANTNNSVKNNSESRYLLRSLKQVPFRLNGVWSFEAFIERGDIVDIGFNRFGFSKPIVASEDALLNMLPVEIIESNLSVLIEGETGTGKTTLAKKIHEASGVVGDFVHLNLSSFSPGLIESELFGHVKGAFTGAFTNKKGAFLQAHRGTLFLDEIDSLPRELQTKLLLFLENFEVRPVGGELSQKVNVRLIFASGRDLKILVADQAIRADFYYRLMSGHGMKLQSLAEDKTLVRMYCKKFEQDESVVISDELISYYEKIYWPGNIRQLKSHLIKKKIFAQGKKIIFNNFDEGLQVSNVKTVNSCNLYPLQQVKYEYCLGAYFKMGKNIKETAKLLQISQNTLRVILKKKDKLGSENIINVNF